VLQENNVARSLDEQSLLLALPENEDVLKRFGRDKCFAVIQYCPHFINTWRRLVGRQASVHKVLGRWSPLLHEACRSAAEGPARRRPRAVHSNEITMMRQDGSTMASDRVLATSDGRGLLQSRLGGSARPLPVAPRRHGSQHVTHQVPKNYSDLTRSRAPL